MSGPLKALVPHREFEVNRRSLPSAAALSAAAVLLLSACGSGGSGGSGPDDIKGADGGGAKASASADPSAPGGAKGRPEITLPDTFKMSFEAWHDDDPKKQAILDDGKEQLRADHAAITDGDAEADYLDFYNTGESLAGSQEWIKQYVKEDLSLVGEIRVFNPKVHITERGTGVLFYCLDEGKAFTKNRQSGEEKGTPAGENPRLQYRTQLNKSPKGVWQTVAAETERGGC